MRLSSPSWRLRGIMEASLFALLVVLLFSFTPDSALAAPPRGNPGTYVVQSGDTLYAIALRYHTTVAMLKQLNGLKGDTIQVGQKVLVPTDDSGAASPAAAPTTSYLVEPGDTLYRIALKFGTTTRALANLNGIPNPNLISVGQGLAIPSSALVVKPGLTMDPPTTRQGGTVLVKVARPELVSLRGTYNGKNIPFQHAAGYFFALVGISRCAKLGDATLTLNGIDEDGKTATDAATLSIAATAFPVQKITLPPGKGDLLEPTLINREEKQLAELVSHYTVGRMWYGAFRQPLTGTVSSQFGARRSYNGGPVGACGHEGQDFAVDAGTPIHSDARGRVVFAGLTQVRGNMVVVDHGLGVYSAYYHQSELAVQEGQMVEAGDLIGKVGTTGLSTGNHLHWSLFVNGEYVDPMEWTRRVFP